MTEVDNEIKRPFWTRRRKKFVSDGILHLILSLTAIIFIFPFIWMLFTALKTPAELLQGTDSFFPTNPQWNNFKESIEKIPFLLYLKNSLVIVALVMIGTVFSATLTAYAFAKLNWKGRDKWFLIMLGTMMIPMQVILIPSFVMYVQIGWLGTILPMVVPAFFGGGAAFYIFMLRQFFKNIPKDLSESAIIDGASHFKIFWHIMLPLCKPALITVALFVFMATWNDYFGPLIFLTDPEQWTLALGLRSFQTQYGGRYDLMMAASILIMLPTLIIFFAAQKQFIEGISFTGIKG